MLFDISIILLIFGVTFITSQILVIKTFAHLKARTGRFENKQAYRSKLVAAGWILFLISCLLIFANIDSAATDIKNIFANTNKIILIVMGISSILSATIIILMLVRLLEVCLLLGIFYLFSSIKRFKNKLF